MATRPKAVIESRNGEKFSPITIAKNVLTDDGQNLHDILSDRKEDMMTPTIENSSSMFKVGQGDSIDFSDNVMDGAYEGVILKGKSLVNVIQGSSKDKVTLDSENATAYPVVIKPNTKYSIVAHKDCNYHTTNLNYTFDLGGATTTCSVNDTITIVTTPSTLAHQELRIKGQGLVISSVRVIEGEVAQDLPYFEGICDVKSPIVKNVGKNLFDIDGEWVHSTYGYNTVSQSKENQVYTKIGANEFKIETGSRYENGFGQYINVQGLEEVRIKATFNDLDTKSPSRIMGARLNKDESLDESITNANHEHYRRGNFVMQAKDGVVDMIVPTNGYSTLFVNFSGSWKNNELGNHIFTVKDVYVGANEDYEPYKSNILSCNGDKIELTEDMFEQGTFSTSQTGATYESTKENNNTRIRSKKLIRVKPSTTYRFKFDSSCQMLIGGYDSNQKCLGSKFSYTWLNEKVFITPADGHYISIAIRKGSGSSNIVPSEFNSTGLAIWEADKTIVLRSLPNGVCDTLNIETGEYVQRIGEVVANGSENITHHVEHSNRMTFRIPTPAVKPSESNQQVICDKFNSITFSNLYNDTASTSNIEGVAPHNQNDNGCVYVSIKKSRLSTPGVDGFKQWLSQNPIVVQYELTIPIIKTADLSGYPFSYKNGHVILSSGSIEQSLTPKVEYSVVTNRNGQIRSNQKMVERHQKQLDRLQAMILANLVNTQYEQTLTNLKYDLKNVREEVK